MRPQPLLRVLSRRQLAIHCSPRVGRPCASASASASFAATSQSRLLHAAPSDARSPPYNSAASFIRHHIPPEVSDRYVMVRSGPVFAIEDDHRELFEESGIAVDKTHMIYNNLGHTDLFLVIVILKSPAQVATAIKELDGAPLFNKRIQVGLSKGPLKTLPSFRWGWYATESSSLHGLALRYPQVSPPKDIFSSYKTGRMVTFHEFPNDNELYLECMKWLYARLHHYNVRGLSRMIAYTPRGCPDIKRSFVTVQFETKEAAEEVQSLYNNQHFHGFPIAVGITKPPMKYLGASWDTGHNQAHNQPRDHGTAEGTNFESMQDEVYRKWLLGSQDRSIWVPGHQY